MNPDLNIVLKIARETAKRESPKASFIFDILIDPAKREYENLFYTYLRWIDDIIDDPQNPVEQKRKFIDRQIDLINSMYLYNSFETSIPEEACLIYLSEYAKSTSNIILIDEVKNMVEAMRMDVWRLERDGIFSNNDLELYIDLMSKSIFNVLCNFALPQSEYVEEYYAGAKFTTIALMIRDLEEDIDNGYINIGSEEICKYNLNVIDLKHDKNFSLWLKSKIKYVLDLLDEETEYLKILPFRFKIFTYYSLIYRLPWIIRAKVYKYKLDYISNRTFLKELVSYFITILISIKIFIRGFLSFSKRNLNNKINLSFSEAKKIAGSYTRKRSFNLWMITRLMLPKRIRSYAHMCFAYLKWVDDFVDDPKKEKQMKLEFVQHQLDILDDFRNADKSEIYRTKKNIKYKQESFLYHMISYAASINHSNSIKELKNSLLSIKIDAERLVNNQLFSEKQLNNYVDMVVRPVFNLTYFGLIKTAINPPKEYAGKFICYVLFLRDFQEDIDSGYINISAEDIQKYNLSINQIDSDKNLITWLTETWDKYYILLADDIKILKSMPLKVRFFWGPIYPYMINVLVRIKVYNFNFIEKNKKEFYKEIKILILSIAGMIKFYYKLFF